MVVKWLKVFCGIIVATLFFARISFAGEIDILVQKLVEKGVLTPGEAQQIVTETKEEVKKEIASGKSYALPAWVQNIKLKGDLRLRYQYKHSKTTLDAQRDSHVGRVRARLGLEAKINEKLIAGIGMATNADGDPRSTNITFGDKDGGYSSKMGVRLDYAYAKYSPFLWLDLVGGKMLLNNVLWEPTDLMWDTDITPEGAVIALNKNLNSDLNVFLNTSAMILDDDETSDSNSSNAFMVQPGVNYKINDKLSLKGAFSYYNFWSVKGATPSSFSGSTNTRSGTYYRYNYHNISPAVELKILEPFGALGFKQIETAKIFGEYVNNLVVTKGASGFSCGFQLGNDKIEKWRDWQIRYVYAMLGQDAVLDVLPDSDRYSGKTGIRSHEASFNFGLGKNTFFGLDIYRSWNIIGTSTKAPETLVQADFNFKF